MRGERYGKSEYIPRARSVIVSRFLMFMKVCGGHPRSNPCVSRMPGREKGICAGGASPSSRPVKDSLFRLRRKRIVFDTKTERQDVWAKVVIRHNCAPHTPQATRPRWPSQGRAGGHRWMHHIHTRVRRGCRRAGSLTPGKLPHEAGSGTYARRCKHCSRLPQERRAHQEVRTPTSF